MITAHVHTATSARPDRVYKTSVWQPYPLYADPRAIARKTVEAFTAWTNHQAPQAHPASSPTKIAAQAQNIAMRALEGIHIPTHTDPRISYAASLMLGGKSFVIRSGGKAAVIRAQGPASYVFRQNLHPISYGVK